MSSLPKEESMGTKLVELLLNRVVERRNMINVYLRGELALRVLGGVFEFELFLALFVLVLSFSCSFSLIYRFSSHLLAFAVFLILDDIIEIFLAFWSSTCTSWGFGFELQTLCFLLSMDSSRGRLRNQVVSSLV
jgi:hypothetical protein